ncbi:sporulation transcriptional regulator SpoIIID [Christensenellaceae bacterium OttesenSCG-928-M15]|nr:sporulation transcriptional regulator SpoIIID [Christensenellaceae bacterium OttesenSCG-928-M15]
MQTKQIERTWGKSANANAYIEERVLMLAEYIVENGATVRGAAKKYNVSKSTVHKDVSDRLLFINPTLAQEVRRVLDVNKAERHIRGGEATCRKYKQKKSKRKK